MNFPWLAGSRRDDTGSLRGKGRRERGVLHRRSMPFSQGMQYQACSLPWWIHSDLVGIYSQCLCYPSSCSGAQWAVYNGVLVLQDPELPTPSGLLKESSRTDLLPSPLPPPKAAFIWPQGLGRCASAEWGSAGKWGACFHNSYGSEGMLAEWRLLGSVLPLPQAGTRRVIRLQVSVGLGGCALFGKSSWRGLYKMFRSKPSAMQSHLRLGVITPSDEVC